MFLKKIKFFKEKVTSIDVEITVNTLMFNSFTDEFQNTLDLTQTFGHEIFLHAFNKSFLAAFMFNSKHYQEVIDLLKRDTGDHGDVDHANYINNRTDGFGRNGISVYLKFIEELREIGGDKMMNEIEEKHDNKYEDLKDEKN